MKRRTFLQGSPIAVATLIGTSPRWAGANDRIRTAQIGMGGRGGQLATFTGNHDGTEVALICDPDLGRLRYWRDRLETETGEVPETLQDMREAFTRDDVDAVLITTCNHWHALAGIWASQAGKHPYVEKPVSHTLWEGRQLVNAVRINDRISQGGTQRRSYSHYKKATSLLHDGVIGHIHTARALVFNPREPIGHKPITEPPENLDWDQWLGPAPMQPFHENLVHYNWHWFWDTGNGELGNNGSHIIDVARWGMGKRYPTRVHSIGGRFAWNDQGETPNTQTTTYTYEDGSTLISETRNLPTNKEEGVENWGVTFYGTKGYMTIDDGKFKVYLERNEVPEIHEVASENEDHIANFFEAVRAGDRSLLNGEIETIHESCVYCHLGNIAWRLGREVRFAPSTETFPGDEEANALLHREERDPYRVPDLG